MKFLKTLLLFFLIFSFLTLISAVFNLTVNPGTEMSFGYIFGHFIIVLVASIGATLLIKSKDVEKSEL